MKARVQTTRQADAQALQIARWWYAHRHAAPELFEEELAGAVRLLERVPAVWSAARGREPRLPGTE